MKKTILAVTALGLLLCLPQTGLALSSETALLLELLQDKGIISPAEARKFSATIEQSSGAARGEAAEAHHHSVKSLATRVEKLEEAAQERAPDVAGHIQFSGLMEVEAATARMKDATGTATDSSDLTLATAELDADAQVNDQVSGHLAILYEEGEENNHLIVDEGIISLNGGQRFPLSLQAGKMYVPFGNYASHLLSDPLPLVLGETNDTAILAGYEDEKERFTVHLGAFNGAVHEAGKEDTINSLVANATATFSPIAELTVTGGASWLSNLAASDTLRGLDNGADGEITDLVAGGSAFLHLEYREFLTLDAEYLGALDDFNLNDMTFTNAANRRPQAWNIEAAATVMPRLETALRYGGSDQVGNELADRQYGIALLYDLLPNTSLAGEYLQERFADHSKNRRATLQLAVEF